MFFSPELEVLVGDSRFARFAKAIDRRTLAQLERLAARMEAPLRSGFLAAIRSARQEATLDEIIRALTTIDPASAIRAAAGGLEFTAMKETLAQLVEASGVAATKALIRITGEPLAAFDMVNPYAVQYARSEVGGMIRGITETTQRGIQNLIGRGIESGITPARTASDIKSMIGLTETQTNWVMSYELKLLERGATNVDQLVERFSNKLLRQRSQMIAETESISAMNAGQQAAWNSAIDQGMLPVDVEQVWVVTPDERLCEICKPIPELEENQHVKRGEVFITGDGDRVTRPPAHPRCRCSLALRL